MGAKRFVVIAGRTTKQGQQVNIGKDHDEYLDMTTTLSMNPDDMKELAIAAGAKILVAAYRQCLRGNLNSGPTEQQAALRCAASVYNTGGEQAGILNGYQPAVWRAAQQIVPAIQFAVGTDPPSPAAPGDTVAPAPRRPPRGLEDALHATPPVPDSGDGLTDASHLTK